MSVYHCKHAISKQARQIKLYLLGFPFFFVSLL
jgi:hypothetical protein